MVEPPSAAPTVLLLDVDDEILERLLAAAIADADLREVMPPVAGPPGWTQARLDAFRAFHRARRALAGPLGEITFAVSADGQVVGSGRLKRTGPPETLETGLWLTRSSRGRGIGTAALQCLLDQARRASATAVTAETTAANAAAVAVLRHTGSALTIDADSGQVHAEIPLSSPS